MALLLSTIVVLRIGLFAKTHDLSMRRTSFEALYAVPEEVLAALPSGARIANLAGLWHENTLAWDAGVRSALAGRIMEAASSAGGTAAGAPAGIGGDGAADGPVRGRVRDLALGGVARSPVRLRIE